MKTLTIRDLRTHPKQVREDLAGDNEAILTANGRPVAILIPVDEMSLDTALDTVRRVRAQQALRGLRAEAREKGLDGMGLREITGAVSRARAARGKAGRKSA
jgi:antitoxin (DNA-binding transcriptional repressor) of toxin-antitoxin stability system